MKRFTPTILGLTVGLCAFGQTPNNAMMAPKQVAETAEQGYLPQPTGNGAEAVIWSEDFASGIPSTWSNQGFDGSMTPLPAAQWEYRGTATTPDNSVGSRGAFATNLGPIASATAGNGFVIFDSDYLDNAGSSATMGQGPAPAPHVGILTTDTIDLTGSADVVLELTSYARMFQSEMYVEFSDDGGATWMGKTIIHSYLPYHINASSPNPYYKMLNVSSYIGGQAEAMVRFVFDGTHGTAPNQGYYFWMLDDIKISDAPQHALSIIPTMDGAPPVDMTMGNGGKFGHMTLKQARPIIFDGNTVNLGSETQTGVGLEVEVYDGSNTLVQTLASSGTTTLNTNDTADFNILTTTAWTPTAESNYTIVYKVYSDSVNDVIAPIARDTAFLWVTDSVMSLDFNRWNNSLGTSQLGDGGAIATRIDLNNDERLFGAYIGISSATAPGAAIDVRVHDTTGFDFIAGFPSSALTANSHTITTADVANGYVYIDLLHPFTGYPIYLETGAPGPSSYFVVVTMQSNGAQFPISLRNDQTLPQWDSRSAIMFDAGAGRWWSGYSNSLTLNSPHIRVVTCPAATAAGCMEISIEEVSLSGDVSVYPNPVLASEEVTLEIGDISGSLDIRLLDIQGRVIMSTTEVVTANTELPISLGNIAPGIYMLNVTKGEATSTFKLTVR